MTYVDNPPLTLDDLRQPPELKYVGCSLHHVIHGINDITLQAVVYTSSSCQTVAREGGAGRGRSRAGK